MDVNKIQIQARHLRPWRRPITLFLAKYETRQGLSIGKISLQFNSMMAQMSIKCARVILTSNENITYLTACGFMSSVLQQLGLQILYLTDAISSGIYATNIRNTLCTLFVRGVDDGNIAIFEGVDLIYEFFDEMVKLQALFVEFRGNFHR